MKSIFVFAFRFCRLPTSGSRCVLYIAVIILFHATSAAQTFTDKGTTELGGTFALTFVGSSAGELGIDNLAVSPYFGVMAAKGFQIGFAPTVGSEDLLLGNDVLVGLYLAPAYNFTTGSKIYPFIEGVVGLEIVNAPTSAESFAWGCNLGTKSNLSGNFLLILQLTYLRQNRNTIENNHNSSSSITTIALSAGFSIFFPQAKSAKKK